jgi:hypothetical protein
LSIVLINGFVPDPSNPDSFQIITFGTHDSSDDFAVYTGTDLGGGLTLVPQFDDTDLTLVANQGGFPGGAPGRGRGHEPPPLAPTTNPRDAVQLLDQFFAANASFRG